MITLSTRVPEKVSRGSRFTGSTQSCLVGTLFAAAMLLVGHGASAQESNAVANQCASNPPLAQSDSDAAWAGWGPSGNNARFQNADAAGITAADVPKLELKWAFAAPGAANMDVQPTVAMGRLFVIGGNHIYSLNAKTGCTYWSAEANAGGRSAPLVRPISGHSGTQYAVFFTDGSGGVYALDAHDGHSLWKAQLMESKGLFRIHSSTTWSEGRLFIPMVATETFLGPRPDYQCCHSRGRVAAVDANTGKILWNVSTIPEPLKEVGTAKDGKPITGPSGASVWNAPTADPERGVVYVGTGNNYGPDPSSTSDSIIALSMKDGHIVWHHQEFEGDSFMVGCPEDNTGQNLKCPKKRGPDWDFGGSSSILQTLPNGKDILLAAGKGGVAIALDPDNKGKVLWRTTLYTGKPPGASGLVFFGGAADGKQVYYPLQQPGGGVVALNIKDGAIVWRADTQSDRRGQPAAASAIPGVVFSGGWNGVLSAIDTATGKVIWTYNAVRDYDTVDHVPGKGGSIGIPGPAIVDGMLYVASGYTGVQGGTGGNVILAFGTP